MSVSCGLIPSEQDFPSSIGFDVPDTMYDDSSSPQSLSTLSENTTEEGPLYEALKAYVTFGVSVSVNIDNLLTKISEAKELFFASLGNKVETSEGWYYADNLNNGYYLYFGENSNETNFYFEWEAKGDGKFKGKAILLKDGLSKISKLSEVEEFCLFYDNSVTYPYLDMYAKFDETSEFNKKRLKLEKLAEGEVRANIKIDLNSDWPSEWLIKGYGKKNSKGGGIGEASGSLIIDFGLGEMEVTKYIYEEHFNSSGETYWKMGEAEVDGTLYIDESITFTNNTVDANVETKLEFEFLTNAEYPVINLP
jgi:hypothetical protein